MTQPNPSQSRLVIPALFFFLLILAGCGTVFVNKGSKNEPLRDGLQNPSENAAKVTVPASQKVICDFEDGSTRMNPQLYGTNEGSWTAYSYAGNTVNSPFVVPGGANGTKMAAHLFGVLNNKGDASYPAFILAGKFMAGGYYDASAFSGIRFYYKCSADDKAPFRRFAIPIGPTLPTSAGGTCTDNCYNHFGKDLAPTDGWVLVSAPFKDLQRIPGWGSPAGSPDFTDHLAEIIDVEWNHNSANTPGKTNIDFWVDEVEFF